MSGSKYSISKRWMFHLLQSRSGVLILCSRLYIGVVSVTAARRFILLLGVCSFKPTSGKNNIEKCPWSCCSCHLEEWKYSVHLITWVSVSSFNYSCCCCCCCCLGGEKCYFHFLYLICGIDC